MPSKKYCKNLDYNTISIYIHWPFCKKKCPYCDFNSYVHEKDLNEDEWLNAYLKSINAFQDIIKNRKIHSIFFGGGTPSLMPIRIIEKILNKLDTISPIKNCEISLEANPTSSEKEKFKELKKIGINRISIGVQSFNDKNLQFLGRQHSAKDAEKAIEEANEIFDNYSIDLIYSLPEQTLDTWEKELNYALKFAKHHISLYQLTIEKGTEFFSLFKNKSFILPDENIEHDLYILTKKITSEHNFHNYEISNFAQTGKESQHNLAYWNYQEYLGIGPGAHSRIKINNDYYALNMVYNPEKWLSLENNVQYQKILTLEEIAREYLLMGLRLHDGIDLKAFKQRFNTNLLNFLNKDKIEYLLNENLLTLSPSKIYLTNKGKLLINYILQQIIK